MATEINNIEEKETKKVSRNNNLHKAKNEKNDEFYTQFDDIEKELEHYTKHFENKVVLCNCDDPLESNFTKFFILKFHDLKLKRLICTFFNGGQAFAFQYDGQDLNGDGVINGEDIEIIRNYKAFRSPLSPDPDFIKEKEIECNKNGIYGSGDFRSRNCIEYLKMADLVVTNPPFSLFREYVAQLLEYNKKFLIIGNPNAITYKEIFPLIKENKMWIGYKSMGTDMLFNVPNDFAKELLSTKKEGSGYKIVDDVVKGRAMAIWFTNLDHSKRHEQIQLFKTYDKTEYPKYDNYDAIEVSKVANIPMDYDGIMGVPISFLDKYNPEQFEIIKFRKGDDDKDLSVNGKCPYFRILIRHKR